MKVCLVHDDLVQLGGAERLFEEVSKIFPDAPIYTSLVNFEKLPKSINPNRIRASFMQKIPFATKFYKALLPFYPLAFESLNFDEFDLVISSTTRFANSIITKPKTLHICYMNSVPRFLYEDDKKNDYLHAAIHLLISPYMKWLNKWDKATASRVDIYIANSKNVQSKIKKFYSRDATVICPPVDTQFFKPDELKTQRSINQNYYLVVSRLAKWKRIDVAINAIGDSERLIIVGSGPDKSRLIKIAKGKKIEFKESISRAELKALYKDAKAFIVTQDEDFGIATAEAQACGTSAIAYRAGGSQEIIIEGKTGIFYNSQNPDSLKDAIKAHSKLKWGVVSCRNNALRFSKSAFKKSFKQAIDYATKIY